jgi:aminopeptidase-like protein
VTGERDVTSAAVPVDEQSIGARAYALCAELFPICRSITGDGVRATLDVVDRIVPTTRHEVPTGTRVFDWTVPQEWNVRDAYVANAEGERVIDFRRSNLHLVGYSRPIARRMALADLRPHLHSLPDRPDAVPYRTTYYDDSWGFCVADADLAALPEGEYEVVIDTSLTDGSLTYGEVVLPGRSEQEVLLTTHVCHPSLANDNVSGIALLALLGEALARVERRYTYRLLFIPGTIGSITWLARNQSRTGVIRHGIVITGVGDGDPPSYKLSRRGDAEVDRAARHVLDARPGGHRIIDFHPYGYDERQFCSPGFDMPVGRFGRAAHGEYPEYHTSRDDMTFIGPAALGDSFRTVMSILDVLEENRRYRSTNPYCEPQLGRRGLYRAVGGEIDARSVELALLWVLNLSDGHHDLLGIAKRASLPFPAVRSAADALRHAGLIEALDD